MWTKRELVLEAYGELALQGYEFELTPEELETGLRRLDTMMATWQQRGVNVSYALPSGPQLSDLDDASGLPDYAVEAVYLNLAIRIGASYGKEIRPETKATAKAAYDPLLWASAMPVQQQLPGSMPIGAGNKYWRGPNRRFVRPPDESPVRTGDNGNIEFLGD